MEESLENIEELELTTPEVMDTWPVVDSIDLGFSQGMAKDGTLDPDKYLHIRLHHRPVREPEAEETITTYALQPGVIEMIVAGMCSANTTTQEDSQQLFDIILGAVAFFREGHNLHESTYTQEEAERVKKAIFEAIDDEDPGPEDRGVPR